MSRPTESEYVSVDVPVQKDHLLRKIERAIDFSFSREKVAGLYSADNGHPAIDPVSPVDRSVRLSGGTSAEFHDDEPSGLSRIQIRQGSVRALSAFRVLHAEPNSCQGHHTTRVGARLRR
ncbi:hypothetical protein EHM69_02155 [candidate division KSB1 bacterium]|nr:MAG: hypothetical protein EHM69_02155 [candidate division KSB1 bacterium]